MSLGSIGQEFRSKYNFYSFAQKHVDSILRGPRHNWINLFQQQEEEEEEEKNSFNLFNNDPRSHWPTILTGIQFLIFYTETCK